MAYSPEKNATPKLSAQMQNIQPIALRGSRLTMSAPMIPYARTATTLHKSNKLDAPTCEIVSQMLPSARAPYSATVDQPSQAARDGRSARGRILAAEAITSNRLLRSSRAQGRQPRALR